MKLQFGMNGFGFVHHSVATTENPHISAVPTVVEQFSKNTSSSQWHSSFVNGIWERNSSNCESEINKLGKFLRR